MNENITFEKCKKCGTEFCGNYCPECGNPKKLQRIDRKYITNQVASVLNFDRGILYTIKELLIRPGITVKNFIVEDRNRIVKPVMFILIASLIYTLLRQIFQFEDGYVSYSDTEMSATAHIFGWVKDNYGYSNLIMGVFIALWVKVLFRKSGYNFYEVLILLCFVMGVGMLIISLAGVIAVITGFEILQFAGIIFIAYSAWAIGQFFSKNKVMGYIKALAAYILGMITFTFGVLLTGNLIDLIF